MNTDYASARVETNEAAAVMATYLFGWNPAHRTPASLAWYIRTLGKRESVTLGWRTGNRLSLPLGSRAFLIRLGVEPKGIIGSGWTRTEPKGSPPWVNIEFDTLAEQPRLPLSLLNQGSLGRFHWSIQGSGIQVPEPVARRLEALWLKQRAQRVSALHITVGTSNADRESLKAAASRGRKIPWPVPRCAEPGDQVAFLIQPEGLMFAGLVASKPSKYYAFLRNWPNKYAAGVRDIRALTRPVSVAELEQRFPRWGWPTYPRGYATVPEAIATKLAKLLSPRTRSGDPLAADLGDPSPRRVRFRTTRVLRDTRVIRALKRLHGDRCQLCGNTLRLPNGAGYSEGHHLKPLGMPHNGPDTPGNVLVLCPNCHALCDLGAVRLSRQRVRELPQHRVSSTFVGYHNSRVCGARR